MSQSDSSVRCHWPSACNTSLHSVTHSCTQHQYCRSGTGWDSGPPNPSPPLTPWMGQWSTQPLSTPHPHGWDSGPPNPSPPLTPWMGQWSTQPLSTPHPMDGTVVHPTPHPSPHGWDSGPPNPSPPLTPWMGQWSTQPLSTPHPMDGLHGWQHPIHPLECLQQKQDETAQVTHYNGQSKRCWRNNLPLHYRGLTA